MNLLDRLTLLVVLAPLLAAGCEKAPPDASPSRAPANDAAGAAKPSDANLEDLDTFLKKNQPAPGDAAAPTTQVAAPPRSPAKAKLLYDAPKEWKPEAPKHPMRLAQYLIYRAEGDAQDGQLIVSHFPGSGGPTMMNITRWKGMFTTADGQPVGDSAAKVEELQVGDLKVTLLDISGLYDDPMMVQSGSAKIEGEARLLGAVVETPIGPYFLKAVGQKKTMDAQEAAFRKFVQSVRMAP